MPIALTSYSVVMALHIMAVLAAYGLPLAAPLFVPYLRRNHPRAMPGVHDVQHRLNIALTGPGTVLILILSGVAALQFGTLRVGAHTANKQPVRDGS